jgi:hypothetical protein
VTVVDLASNRSQKRPAEKWGQVDQSPRPESEWLRLPVNEVNEPVLQTVERHALTEAAIEQVIHFAERDDVADLQTKIEREHKDDRQAAEAADRFDRERRGRRRGAGGAGPGTRGATAGTAARRHAPEDIGPEDTGEADFGRLLERAYDKNNVGGLASPAGTGRRCTFGITRRIAFAA